MFELRINNKKELFAPGLIDDVTWTTTRQGAPGELTFKVHKTTTKSFYEGDNICLYKGEKGIFNGFVFTKKRDKESIISVTAYDQLRYFKNKDTYVYENKTSGAFIKILARDFNLQVGDIVDTGFKIKSRVEDNTTLFDMVQNSLDLTLESTRTMFVLYDDFGKLTLKNIKDLKLDLLIDDTSGENFDYSSSIDSNTYNKVKLMYENEKSGKRDVYIAQHGFNINNWGILQYFDKLQEGENGKKKADALLKLYNSKTKNLSISNVFGDIRVRGGSMVLVKLNLGDMVLSHYMMVETCKHKISLDEHTMDLTLRGGEFVV